MSLPSEMRVCKFQLLGGRVTAAEWQSVSRNGEAGGRTRHLASVKARETRGQKRLRKQGSAELVGGNEGVDGSGA